jgi:putative acetyltransferase
MLRTSGLVERQRGRSHNPRMVHQEAVLAVEDPLSTDSAALVAELRAGLETLYPEDAEDPPPSWSSADLARIRTFVLARIAGEPAGCAALAPIPDSDALEVVRMYVRPAYRGRRLADQLLGELEKMARERSARALLLRCGPRQPEALRVYERNGFRRRAAFAHHREHPTNVFYEKRLGEK